MSLGIDPISTKSKTCNFDCVYCQLGKTTAFENVRQEFVPTEAVIEEIKRIPGDIKIDYLTFSGRGETTLASNLGEMISAVRAIRDEKIAVITNSTLFPQEDVQEDLLASDHVMAKLDACSQETFEQVNRAMEGIHFQDIVAGIQTFRSEFKGKLGLQIMFVEANKLYAPQIADIARKIQPDEIELNTPLRPSAVNPLSPKEMEEIEAYFEGLRVISVYRAAKKPFQPLDKEETEKRHGSL